MRGLPGVVGAPVVKVCGGVALALVDEVAIDREAAMKAMVSAIIMPIQKTGLTRPESIAPGMIAITTLSVSSITAIERVSAANTTLSAAKNDSPAFSRGRVERA